MYIDSTDTLEHKGFHRSGEESERTGWLEVICGSMFSGKTEELIRRLKRAEFANLKVEIFKPKIDTRYSEAFKKQEIICWASPTATI